MQAQAQLPPATSRAPVAWLTVTRKGIVGVVVCAVAALAVFALADLSSEPSTSMRAQPTSLSVPTVASATVLSRQPWIGVACPGPVPFNAARAITIARACNRVGLAIELRKPAMAATATINGQTFKLDNRAESSPPLNTGKRMVLAGFLQPARFLHGPFKTITYRNGLRQRFTIENVHLVIDYGAGHTVQTSLQLLGYGGWG